MRQIRSALSLVVVSLVLTAPLIGAASVPFNGSWSGVTVSADPAGFPIVAIVAEGTGQLTHLGRYFMTSPHTTNVFSGETKGDQIFSAANGDQLTAYCQGFPVFDPITGIVEGNLDCEITGGTGRFEGASGEYVFFLHGTPLPDRPGFATEAQIAGRISY